MKVELNPNRLDNSTVDGMCIAEKNEEYKWNLVARLLFLFFYKSVLTLQATISPFAYPVLLEISCKNSSKCGMLLISSGPSQAGLYVIIVYNTISLQLLVILYDKFLKVSGASFSFGFIYNLIT